MYCSYGRAKQRYSDSGKKDLSPSLHLASAAEAGALVSLRPFFPPIFPLSFCCLIIVSLSFLSHVSSPWFFLCLWTSNNFLIALTRRIFLCPHHFELLFFIIFTTVIVLLLRFVFAQIQFGLWKQECSFRVLFIKLNLILGYMVCLLSFIKLIIMCSLVCLRSTGLSSFSGYSLIIGSCPSGFANVHCSVSHLMIHW